MVTFIWTIQIISALLLVVLILLHSPKGDGIAGMGGASQIFSSQKSAEKGLNKVTGIIAGIFILCTFPIGIVIVMIAVSFLKDAKLYLEELQGGKAHGEEKKENR